MNVPLSTWAAVLAVILAMLAVDLLAHRTAHVVSVKEAAVWSAIWVSLGLKFGGVVWWAGLVVFRDDAGDGVAVGVVLGELVGCGGRSLRFL